MWEFLQVPFYREMAAMPHWDATLICLQATVGDVGLTLLAYGAVSLIVRAPLLQWIMVPPAVLWLSRRHLGQGSYPRAASDPM